MFHFLFQMGGFMKFLKNIGIRISFITILINFLLFLFKLIAGIMGHSGAMVSDAVHSLSDVITTILVIFGLVMSSKSADREHPYGHERIESVFGIILSFMLFLTGAGIGYNGLLKVIHHSNLVVPGLISLIAALISILVKESMYHYTIYYAKKLNSTSLRADAWHHRSDALSSIASFIAILASRLGLPILDPICSMVISIFIMVSAISIFKEATKEMVDTAVDSETYNNILNTIKNCHEDLVVNDLKTRMFGSKIYIDLEIAIDGNTSLKKADNLAQKIHNKVEQEFNLVKHCNIHVIPKK